MGFQLFKVQGWSVSDNLVYCNILRSTKTAYLEVEITVFTVAAFVLTFMNVSPGPYTCSEQPKIFHSECILKVICEK